MQVIRPSSPLLIARRHLHAAAQSIGRARSGPGRERDLAAQAAKAALAACLAWAVAGWWLDAPMAFVAPWTAIVLVESTVYRSIAHGLQQLGAIATGTVVATTAALLLHSTMLAMALVLPAVVLVGNWRRLGNQGVNAATGALFVLVSGPVGIPSSAARLAEAVFGAAVGIAVNALVRPPVYLRDTRAALRDATREAHDILLAVADGLAGDRWDTGEASAVHERALRLYRLVEQAHEAIGHGRESLRANLRGAADGQWTPDEDYDDAVLVLDYAAVHTAGVTRTLLEVTRGDGPTARPHPQLARHYADFLRQSARALDLYGRSRFGHHGDEELHSAVEDLNRTLDGLRLQLAQATMSGLEDIATYGTLLAHAHRLATQLATPRA
ncbi:aromatic acid exporter family protein [Streptomyces sp. NPDC001941]|uniref:FUSC family protein n=1 Tax=Streptomyces sp. NPDC001941 TaxID=3154659 RepID=UPI00331AFCD0